MLLAGEAEKVVDVLLVHIDVEFDIVATNGGQSSEFLRRSWSDASVGKNGAQTDNAPSGSEVRAAKRGLHGVKPSVAIGAVDTGVEARVERQRAGKAVKGEVGHVAFTVHDKVAERTGVIAGGAERAGDVAEAGKVGMIELVGTGNGRGAGVVEQPGTEVTAGTNDAFGTRVDDLRLELDRVAGSDVSETQLLDAEAKRQLIGPVVGERQLSVVALHALDDDASEDGVGGGGRRLRGRCGRRVLSARGYVDGESGEADKREDDGLAGLVTQRGVEVELVELDEGSRRRGCGWMRGPDAQAAALGDDTPVASCTGIERNVELVELDAGVEAIGQSSDNLRAEERFDAAREDSSGNRERDNCHKCDAGQPNQPAVPAEERPWPRAHGSILDDTGEDVRTIIFRSTGDGIDFKARMNVEIETLAKLQATELERARLLKEAKALPAQITEAEKELATARKSVADAEAALKREEELREKQERDAEQHRQKAVRYRKQLDTVTTPAQAAAIEHEVTFAESEIERLEGEEFASLERTEAQEAALAAANKDTSEWIDAVEKTRARVAQKQAEIATAVAAVEAEAATLRKAADAELLARYDRIAASRGTGLALAENQQCTGCRMGIRPQVWNELREDLVRTCDSCGRLLFWNPAIVAEPKTPQAETPTANGDGRAIRRPRPADA